MTSIRAEAVVHQPPDAVFAFLADLRNHWRLEGRFVDLEAVDGRGSATPTGGRVRIRGPLGLSRVARTQVLEAVPPQVGAGGRLRGRADVGAATVGRVAWDLEPTELGTRVALSATVERASPADRVILALGGRAWLRRLFQAAVSSLERVLTEDRSA